MSTSNPIANGGKLDDCHSSVYSLAGLTGLRWRTYSFDLNLLVSPCDDPILLTFSKCLAQDILAVWRKKPSQKKNTFSLPQGHPNFEEDMHSGLKKELWIFWWGNENDPSVEEIGRQSGLTPSDESSWEDQGLSYECRTLLFKAIHNLIERCLLAENFVRIGKWFLRPYKKESDEEKYDRLSVSFKFFLKGENTVCTTVDIARHQPVERITNQYLYSATNNAASKNVILSPYGLRAAITGVVFKSPHEQAVKTVIDEWQEFYPIDILSDRPNLDDHENIDLPVPPVIEVSLSRVRMNYPSAYVLVPVENHSQVKDTENRQWNADKRPMDGTSHQGDFPSSIGSLQDSVGISASEMALTASLDAVKDSCDLNDLESTSSLVKNLIARVVNASQFYSESELNGVASHLSENHPSPECKSNGLKLNYQFRKARQVMNYLPLNDDDLYQASGRQKYMNDNAPITDARQKVEKLKQFQPFHRSSVEPSPPRNACPPPMPQSFPTNYEQNSIMPMFPPQTPGFVNYSQFNMVQDEAQKLMEPQTPIEPMFYPNSNDVTPITGNFQNPQELDHGRFHCTITDEAISNASVGEIKAHISVWKKIMIPKDEGFKEGVQAHQSKLEPPGLVRENLDSEIPALSSAVRSIKRVKGSINSVLKEHSWMMDSKKRKIEEDNAMVESSESATTSSTIGVGSTEQVIPQHVRVVPGAVPGELAGMTVLSDPYEFEDDEKDNDSAPSFMWPSNDNSESSALDLLSQKNPHMSSLLKSNPQDQPFTRGLSIFDDTTGTEKPTTSLMDERDLKVSAMDLNNIFDDGDDDMVSNKMPTSKNVHVKFEAVGMFPILGSSDISQHFPSAMKGNAFNFMDPHVQNPIGREQVRGGSCANIISVENLGTLGGRMSGTTHGYGRIFEDKTNEQNEVFSKQPLSKQPLTDKYTPIPLKSLLKTGVEGKMMHMLTYTPTWQMQVEQFHNPQTVMHAMDPSEDVGYMQTGTPLPQLYSVTTPASVPQQSPMTQQTPRTPRTPRPGSSPATSTPNPTTHGRFPIHTPLTSVSSSVAQSEIGSCRASSIYVNLMLSDSVLNLFRDISFDQCPMCVCNDTGNIHSRDVDLGYLPSMADNSSDGQYPCSCGFSAVRNRNLSVGAGLFLEDELDIIGKELEAEVIKSMEALRKPVEGTYDTMISFAMKQAPNPYVKLSSGSTNVKCRVYNIAAQHDIMEACVVAINGGITVMETMQTQQKIQLQHCKNVIHNWIDSRVMRSPSSADIYKLMVALKPILQSAIQNRKKECHFNFIQHVYGPLTWREFCKDTTAPLELPVPMLLVGQSSDWMKVSPFALDYWEKLYLEPYAGMTHIWYLTFCPDADHVFTASKFFFTELNLLYDLCRLGTHKPLVNTRNMVDGEIFSVSSNADVTAMRKNCNDPGNPDSSLPNHTGSDGMKSVDCYVAACRDILFKLFGIVKLPPNASTPTDSQGPQMPGSMPNSIGKPGSNRPATPLPISKIKTAKDFVSQFTNKQNIYDNPTLMLYFIDPFIGGNSSAFSIAIWKCYSEITKSLPESKRNSVVIQLVSLEDILQYPGSSHKSSVSAARSLAFSSYFQCRYRVASQASVRSMTAFGPASTKSEVVQESKLKHALPAIHSRAYVLAGSKTTQKDALVTEKKSNACNILYVTYCLTHDQKWLIASATDQDGEILETFCVNIDVPPRRVSLRRKHRICVKVEAIQKLWKLILSVVTSTASVHWRIVIGRLGRLGHGEIQEWSKHLNRRNFSSLSKHISTKCNQCMLNGAYKHPSIFSACLTSMEPEGSFTILPDSVSKVALFGRSSNSGQQVQLKTPEDASCTHIFVFPTSSFVQTASGGTFQNENDDLLNGLGLSVFSDPGDLPIDGIVEGLFETTSPGGDVHQADEMGQLMKPQPDRLISTDIPEEIALQQQPLALGYLVSTAPTGPLPDSFWASCPHAQFRCPAFLRFALHIQVSSEEGQNMGTGAGDSNDEHHQLDSHKTAQVLRYVMENYNALSWLTCDPISRDRRSCLPIHYHVLTRLYHAIKELS